MKFEFKANPVTGKQEASFTAKLVSDAPKSLLTYQNASGATKEYGIVSVEFEDASCFPVTGFALNSNFIVFVFVIV